MRNMLLTKKLFLIVCLLAASAIAFSQVTEKWVKRENGDGKSDVNIYFEDQAKDLVVDNKSNVIVTGFSAVQGTGFDYATVKYNDDGVIKWAKRYNGPGNGDDKAAAIATDSRCNVYVTGSSTGNGSGSDYATVKYDQDGNSKWVKRFNGPGNSGDGATAIAVDEYGNVYVTGSSTGNGTGADITTIKYDADGHTKWVKSYNGPGNGQDQATAILVDKNGNVYITGWSTGNGTDGDYITIKYDGYGNTKWINRYNGPSNIFDRSNALALDAAGNVYVTGLTALFNTEDGYVSDIATIKYNAAGIQQWVQIYDRNYHDEGNAIAVDSAGNAYLTGTSGTVEEDPLNDIVTLKYNTAGVQQWQAILPFTGGEQGGGGRDLVLDKAGNVYITGGISRNALDFATVKYNANGVQQWVAYYDRGNDYDEAFAIGLDKNGNVYVTGASRTNDLNTFLDYATIKYNAAGVQQWVRGFNGANYLGAADFANALALDKTGNVHVTGFMTRLNTDEDYATFKYTGDGDRIWKKTYNGTGNGTDEATEMVVDADGNVYVAGLSEGPGHNLDFVTVKYDKDGNSKWGKRYDGPAHGADWVTGIATDANGNVYVTGQSAGIGSAQDYATIKYDAAGNIKWVKRYNGPNNNFDSPKGIAVDAQGNVYVTGLSEGSGSGYDIATIKYDANGNQLWVIRYNGPGNSTDAATALAVDAFGNIYVTGYSFAANESSSDITTIKYNPAGTQLWVVRSNAGTFSEGLDIALDAASNIYVTGFSITDNNSDYATVKYNAAGVQQWVARYDAAGYSDQANALAVDAQGNVYVTGQSSASADRFSDYATVKYNTAGVQQWVIRYNGPAGSNDVATDIAVDGNGNVFVTGRSFAIGTSYDYATIKYEQTPLVTMNSATDAIPNNLAGEQREPAKLTVKAFPNAFTQYINLQWSGSDKPVTITITDDMGRLVEKRTGLAASGALQTGDKFTKGVYFAEIVQGTEKLVLKLVKQ